jgi:hypothetical protein
MGWLYRTALRLVTRKRLKSERTRLLLEMSWLLEDTRGTMSKPIDEILRTADKLVRVNQQLDSVNDEIGRRGK